MDFIPSKSQKILFLEYLNKLNKGVKMEENLRMLKRVKGVADENWFALLFLSVFGLLYKNNYLTASNFSLILYLILLIASSISLLPLSYKNYIYEESILNSASKKVLIAFKVCSAVGGLLPVIPTIILGILHLLNDTSFHVIIVFFYIGVVLLLLSILFQIYYFSRMKITYFFILLLGVFILEYFILSYYPLWTVNGLMATFILISTLIIVLDVIIYRKI